MDPSAKKVLLAKGVAISLFSIFQMGFATAYPNTAIDSFRRFLDESMGGISQTQFNWIWSSILNVYFIGFAAGSWMAVPLADRIGRKWCLLVGNSSNFVASFLSFMAVLYQLPWLFFVSRILLAIAAALSMNSLILLLQESSPSSLRGLMSFNAEMAFVVMNLVGAVAGMQSVLGKNLPLLLGLGCIPTLISVILVLFFHESPKYLTLQKKDDESANKALCFYQRLDSSARTLAILAISDEKVDENSKFSDIFRSPKTLFGLLLGIVTMQLTSSIWPILYYSTEFLRKVRISTQMAENVSSAMLFISSISTVVGMFLVERLPRKKLLLTSASCNVAALFVFTLSEFFSKTMPFWKYGCVAAIVFHGITYSIGLGPIAWFITAELVPQNHRAICQSVALSVNQLMALGLCFVTLPLYNSMGSAVILFLFTIPGFFCILFLSSYLPETRNRGINYVQSEMPDTFCGIPIRSARGERIAMEDLYDSPFKFSPRDLDFSISPRELDDSSSPRDLDDSIS